MSDSDNNKDLVEAIIKEVSFGVYIYPTKECEIIIYTSDGHHQEKYII